MGTFRHGSLREQTPCIIQEAATEDAVRPHLRLEVLKPDRAHHQLFAERAPFCERTFRCHANHPRRVIFRIEDHVRESLVRSRRDRDLASIRDAAALAGLEPDERERARDFWRVLEALLERLEEVRILPKWLSTSLSWPPHVGVRLSANEAMAGKFVERDRSRGCSGSSAGF